MFENGASYINIFWSLHEQRADGENYGTHIGFERPAGKGSRRLGQSSPGLTLGTDHTSFWFSKHFWCVLPFIPGAPALLKVITATKPSRQTAVIPSSQWKVQGGQPQLVSFFQNKLGLFPSL